MNRSFFNVILGGFGATDQALKKDKNWCLFVDQLILEMEPWNCSISPTYALILNYESSGDGDLSITILLHSLLPST